MPTTQNQATWNLQNTPKLKVGNTDCFLHNKWIELQNKMICYNAFWTSAATTFHTFIMNNLLIHSIGLKLNYFLVHAPNIIHLSILVQPFFFETAFDVSFYCSRKLWSWHQNSFTAIYYPSYGFHFHIVRGLYFEVTMLARATSYYIIQFSNSKRKVIFFLHLMA